MADLIDTLQRRIRSELPEGTIIRNWSQASGYLNTRTKIENVEQNAIVVSSEDTAFPRRINMDEIARINSHWDDYCAGRFPRHRLRDESHNSTYILAILHWYYDLEKYREPCQVNNANKISIIVMTNSIGPAVPDAVPHTEFRRLISRMRTWRSLIITFIQKGWITASHLLRLRRASSL